MNRPKKFVVSAATALAITALGGVGISTAHAAVTHPSTSSSAAVTHTSPESGSASDGPGGHADPAGNVQNGDQSTADTAKATGAEATTPESGSASDGPGGHADPAGNVQNQGGVNEQ